MYKKLAEYRSFSVFVNTGLSCLVLFAEMVPSEENKFEAYTIAVTAIILLAIHNYLAQSYSIEKSNKADYWEKRFTRHTWLLDSIRNLIMSKTDTFRSEGDIPDNFRDKSIKLTLQMIYEFYKSCDLSDSPPRLRMIYQEASSGSNGENRLFLSVKYWYYSDNTNPHYQGDENEERRFFNLNVDHNHPENTNLPVKAYHSRKTQIFENSGEIPYHYDGQIQHLKSIISYPVVGIDGKSVLGVISVSSDQENFFMRKDIIQHEEYLVEFGIRIAMELTARERVT